MTNVNEDQNGWQVVNRLCPRRPNSKHSVSKRKDATHPASIKSLIPEKKTGEESHRVHKFTDIKLTPPDTPPHNQNESPVVSGDEIFSSCLETDDINEDIFHDDPYETILVSWKKLSELRPVKWLQPRGLANYGNMCFLNAVLQTVVHAPPIAALLSLLSQRISHYLDMQKAPFLYALYVLIFFTLIN